MNPAKHTPGPWRYSEKHHAIVADCFPAWSDPSDPDQEKVTKVCTLMGALGGHNPEADKAMMIAAPELLAALEGCADALREAGKDFAQANKLAARPNLYELHEQSARAAIARATGGNAS